MNSMRDRVRLAAFSKAVPVYATTPRPIEPSGVARTPTVGKSGADIHHLFAGFRRGRQNDSGPLKRLGQELS